MISKNYCTTIAAGRTHLANFDDKKNSNYIGSVNSYNNIVTRLFSRLFNLSIDITVNGCTLKLNKSSYLKLLEGAGIQGVNAKNIKDHLSLDNLKFLSAKGPMRPHLPSDKQNRLGKKMIKQMENKQWDQALYTAHKGANVDLHFFFEDEKLLSFGDPLNRPRMEYSFEKKYETFNPALYAAKEGKKDFIEEIKKLGASLTHKGTRGVFTRELLSYNDVCRNVVYEDRFQTISEYHIDENFNLATQAVDKTQNSGKNSTIFPKRDRMLIYQALIQQSNRKKNKPLGLC